MGKKRVKKKKHIQPSPKQSLFPFYFIIVTVLLTIVLSLILSYTSKVYDIRSKAAESIKSVENTNSSN